MARIAKPRGGSHLVDDGSGDPIQILPAGKTSDLTMTVGSPTATLNTLAESSFVTIYSTVDLRAQIGSDATRQYICPANQRRTIPLHNELTSVDITTTPWPAGAALASDTVVNFEESSGGA